ncbi:hypothetical protein [Staphylococcus delphini]|uniref:hypothetical protein n=1 Tax=Staphylococcus delphini TaxID=53344 RepID=UPI0021D06CF2|nr:hypothetical protein [Staphylococcus delphini]UXS21197.1 hypothetical protein MUA22_10240 [Staphylococcus delphini]
MTDYKSERDTLITDVVKLRNERDELIMSNHKVIQDNTTLRRERDVFIKDITVLCKQYDKVKDKLDRVVDLFNTHLYHKKAWSDNPYYDRVQQRLNEILDGYPVETTRFQHMYSTEIEQALKNKNLEECLFLLEKIKMDLEEDE